MKWRLCWSPAASGDFVPRVTYTVKNKDATWVPVWHLWDWVPSAVVGCHTASRSLPPKPTSPRQTLNKNPKSAPEINVSVTRTVPGSFARHRERDNVTYGTKVCRYNWHSAGSLGWPFPMLKYK